MNHSNYKGANFGLIAGWDNYMRYRWMLHLLVWLIYIFSFAYIYALIYDSVKLSSAIPQYSLTAWVDAFAAYFSVYFLMPTYLMKKKYLRFTIFFILSAILMMLLQRIMLIYVVYPLLYPEYSSQITFFRFNYIFTFFNIYVMTFLFASVKLFEYWYINQRYNAELQKQKMESELKFLKSQIHPHFLFNTLNNLYALTLDRSEKAPEVVVKLSDLLSYMLYECNADFVPLNKEVQLLHDYLGLEKIRYRKELTSEFEIHGNTESMRIPPLLLLPFVENAFKHGLSRKIDQPWVRIFLALEKSLFTFRVENNKPTDKQKDEAGYTEGIGLKNVRRRLDLIYGDDYRLDIMDDDKKFSIVLNIDLKTQNNY